MHSSPAIDGQGNVFLFDFSARAPFAVEEKTGKRRWTGEADPDMPARKSPLELADSYLRELPRYLRRSRGNTGFSESAEMVVAGDTLVVSVNSRLLAYAAKDGRRLWSRRDDCHPRDARGPNVLLECYGRARGFVVVAATSGKTILSGKKLGEWGDKAHLTSKALVLASEEQSALQSQPLANGGPSWKVNLPKKSAAKDRSITLGGPRTLVGNEEVLVRLGDGIVAIDAATGRRLWQREDLYTSRALLSGSEVWLATDERLLVLNLRTGKTLHDDPLPPIVLSIRDLSLTAVGSRILFVGSAGRVNPDAIMVTWTREDPHLVVLRRPASASNVVVDGPVLLAASSFDGVLSALDPTVTEPPLSSLPAEAAVAALLDELGPVERLLDSALAEVPGLGHYFAGIARQPSHQLYDSALLYLGRIPAPEALPVLLDRLKLAADLDEKQLLRAALAKQDDRRATDALLAEVRNEPKAKDRAQVWRERAMSAHLHEQVWRTGRTTDFGLCPKAGTHPLPMPKQSTLNEIGTAHPLIFQDVSPDGSWVYLCQARSDTDGDGKIEVHFGHHGEAYGDEIRPYLVLGSGPGYPVDDVLDSDPTGRYVAVREGPCLSLIDTHTRSVTSLPNADLREADAVFGPARAVSFDASGSQLLYLRGGVPREQVIVRDLTTGKERSLDPGVGNLWRASLDAGGAWITIETVDGPEWPMVTTTLASRICRGPPASYGVYGSRGTDLVKKRVLSVRSGQAQSIAGLVRPFGSNLLVREADGALAETDATGTVVRALVPAECKARVLHADGKRGLVLAACQAKRNAAGTLELFAGDGARTLAQGDELSNLRLPDHDVSRPGQPRFVRVAENLTVDLDRKLVTAEPAMESREACATTDWHEHQQGIYARRGDGTELRGPPSGERRNGPPLGPLLWMAPIKE